MKTHSHSHTAYKSFANYKCLHFHCNKWRYQLDAPPSSAATSTSTSTTPVTVISSFSNRCYVSDDFSISLKWERPNNSRAVAPMQLPRSHHQRNISSSKSSSSRLVSQKMAIIESVRLCNKNATLPFIAQPFRYSEYELSYTQVTEGALLLVRNAFWQNLIVTLE